MINKFVLKKTITVIKKSITGADGYIISIPDETDTTNKLLHQPHIPLSGNDACWQIKWSQECQLKMK